MYSLVKHYRAVVPYICKQALLHSLTKINIKIQLLIISKLAPFHIIEHNF